VLPKAVRAGKVAATVAEDGAKAARGVLEDASLARLSKDASLYNKTAGKVFGKVNLVDAVTPTGQLTKEAIIAGAGFETAKQGAIKVGGWEAQPYIEDAKHRAQGFAASIFTQKVSGR
jgi:hypothetical protein